MNKEKYAKALEESLKKGNISKSELSKAIGCSQDQITRLIKEPESTNIERVVSASDYMGIALSDVLQSASDVRFACDNPLKGEGKK